MGEAIRRWATESVEERQRLAYWMDSICDSFLEMKAQPESRTGFFGSIRQTRLENVAVNEALGSSQAVARDASLIAKGTHNHYYLITQLGSPWSIRHAGRESVLQPGDSVLVDSREPYEFRFPDGLHNLSLQLPLDWVARWLPEPAALLGCPIDGSRGWGAALRAFKEALTPEFAADPGLPAALLEDHLGALMRLATGAIPDASRGLRSSHARCLATMRERLSEPGLLASDVALQAALSLRSLHRAFAAEGRTFAGVLREMRLAEAARMLADRHFARLPMAEISRRCGYADTSRFAQQFRRARGCSPGLFRVRSG